MNIFHRNILNNSIKNMISFRIIQQTKAFTPRVIIIFPYYFTSKWEGLFERLFHALSGKCLMYPKATLSMNFWISLVRISELVRYFMNDIPLIIDKCISNTIKLNSFYPSHRYVRSRGKTVLSNNQHSHIGHSTNSRTGNTF